MKSVLFALGTRPEVIKIAPLIRQFKSSQNYKVLILNTGQHQSLIQDALDAFQLTPDLYFPERNNDLTLDDYFSVLILQSNKVLKAVQPDLVVVHGDTSTSAAVTISSYLNTIPVAHIEAGLRSGDLLSPFPEEGNRRIIDGISTLHFPPTNLSAQNIAEELHLKSHKTFGNTIVDAVQSATSDTNFEFSSDLEGELRQVVKGKYILVTQHRRESFGPGIHQVFEAIAALAENVLPVIFPVHPNPNVRAIAMEVFSGCSSAHLIDPVEYLDMINLISRAEIVISDSGGIQEECAILGKPVLITRNVTERPEVIQSGNGVLVGTDKELIYSTAARILSDKDLLLSMSKKSHLFGDGKASLRIFKVIEDFLLKAK